MYDIYVLITMRFSKMFFLLTYFSYFGGAVVSGCVKVLLSNFILPKTLYFCAIKQPVIK